MPVILSPALRGIVLKHAQIDIACLSPAEALSAAPAIIECLRREYKDVTATRQAVEKSALIVAEYVQAAGHTIPNATHERLESWELGSHSSPSPGNSVFDGLGIVQAMEAHRR
ncbi:MAG: hypothetical protein K8T25_11435 [Planctomycetia bacterium]|nr:hypothetical protein [Planctomycetia bacterium]